MRSAQVKAAMVDSANESVARLRGALAAAEAEAAEGAAAAAAARAGARDRAAEEGAECQRLRCAPTSYILTCSSAPILTLNASHPRSHAANAGARRPLLGQHHKLPKKNYRR